MPPEPDIDGTYPVGARSIVELYPVGARCDLEWIARVTSQQLADGLRTLRTALTANDTLVGCESISELAKMTFDLTDRAQWSGLPITDDLIDAIGKLQWTNPMARIYYESININAVARECVQYINLALSQLVDCNVPQLIERGARRWELWFDGMLVKRIGVRASGSLQVLKAFQDSSWPRQIEFPDLVDKLARGLVRTLNDGQSAIEWRVIPEKETGVRGLGWAPLSAKKRNFPSQ
jgi:hypothetical protein